MANRVGRPALVSVDAILAALSGGPLTNKQIAAAINANTAQVNVTNAVERAVEAGLVFRGGSVRSGGVGRPAYTYQLTPVEAAVEATDAE